MIPTPQVLHLFCFGDQAQTAQTPLLLNLPRALLLMFPVHARLLPSCERCRVAQLSPSQPAQSPLDPPAPAAPLWCPLQSSQSPPADIPVCFQPFLFVPHAPGVGALPLNYWSHLISAGEAPVPMLLFSGTSQPWCHPARCFSTLCHGQGGAQVSTGTFLVCSVYLAQTPGLA